MKFSKTYTYVLFSVLLLSSTVISDHVSSLPLTIVEELKSNSMDGYSNYDDVLRLVPTGPNPMKSLGTPPTPPLSESLYGFEHFDDILRRVPKGTNPEESPPLNVLRTVPSGPDPKHHEEIPPTPPASELLRHVPKCLN